MLPLRWAVSVLVGGTNFVTVPPAAAAAPGAAPKRPLPAGAAAPKSPVAAVAFGAAAGAAPNKLVPVAAPPKPVPVAGKEIQEVYSKPLLF